MSPPDRHFVQIADALRETNPWTNNEWLCRPDIVPAEKLLLVRVGGGAGAGVDAELGVEVGEVTRDRG